MGKKIIKGTEKISKAIKERRLELELTIEEAALRAGVGTKTWCRYEAGESIRKDKAKGVCKALNWRALPSEDTHEESDFDISEYKTHKAWSEYICECHSEAAAISFVIGSDILLDYIEEDLNELAALPKGTHIGQIDISMLKDILPEQFLMQYDYEFLYCLKTNLMQLRKQVHYAGNLIAHSVLQELLIYLIVREAEFLMETMYMDMEACGVEGLEDWEGWIYDLFGDMDIVTCLYSDIYLTNDHCYHFEHWMEAQFYV